MLVSRIVYLSDFVRRDDANIDGCVGFAARLRVDRSERPDDESTLAALGDGVVGMLVGNLKDGTPAIAALYLNADGSVRHGSPQPKAAAFAGSVTPA